MEQLGILNDMNIRSKVINSMSVIRKNSNHQITSMNKTRPKLDIIIKKYKKHDFYLKYLDNFNIGNMGHRWHNKKFIRVALRSDSNINAINEYFSKCDFNGTLHIFRSDQELLNCENDYEVVLGIRDTRPIFNYDGKQHLNAPKCKTVDLGNVEYLLGTGSIAIIKNNLVYKTKNFTPKNEFQSLCVYLSIKFQYHLACNSDNIVKSYGIVKIKANAISGQRTAGHDDQKQNFINHNNVDKINIILNNNYALIQELVKPSLIINSKIVSKRRRFLINTIPGYQIWNRDPNTEFGLTEDDKLVIFDTDQFLTKRVIEEYNGQIFNSSQVQT